MVNTAFEVRKIGNYINIKEDLRTIDECKSARSNVIYVQEVTQLCINKNAGC